MEKLGRMFTSIEKADEHDYQSYASLSPEERSAIGLELYWMWHDPEDEATQRLARVYQFTSLESS